MLYLFNSHSPFNICKCKCNIRVADSLPLKEAKLNIFKHLHYYPKYDLAILIPYPKAKESILHNFLDKYNSRKFVFVLFPIHFCTTFPYNNSADMLVLSDTKRIGFV